MRWREPWSRACEESLDCLTFQATTSGNIQAIHAIQKIAVSIGLTDNGKLSMVRASDRPFFADFPGIEPLAL